jgi:PKD repeat protein
LTPVTNFTVDYKYGNFPLSVRFLDLSLNRPLTWKWTFEGGTPSSSTEQNPFVNFELPGSYRITLTTANNYGNDTLIREGYIHVIDPVGIFNPESESIHFFPNPVNDELTITYGQDFKVKIFNMQGELILTDANKPRLILKHLKPGIYILELETKKSFYRHKLLKQ